MATPHNRMLARSAAGADAARREATDSLANTGTDAAALVPPAPETVLAVPPELQRMLQAQVIDAPGHAERLTHFLFDEGGLHRQYQPGATHDVAEAFGTRRADCLGFTILAVARAHAAGLHAQGQELERILARDLDAGTAIQITHANAGLIASGRHCSGQAAANAALKRTQARRSASICACEASKPPISPTSPVM